MAKPPYDIQGVPIRVGSLVAFSYEHALMKDRVAVIRSAFRSLVLESGIRVPHCVCVVLEEPVWPAK